jgi:hypothetical protein
VQQRRGWQLLAPERNAWLTDLGMFSGVPPCEQLTSLIGPKRSLQDPLGNFTKNPDPALLQGCSESSLRILSGGDLSAALRELTPPVKLMTIDLSLHELAYPYSQLRMLPGSVNLINCEDKWVDLRKLQDLVVPVATVIWLRCRILFSDVGNLMSTQLWLVHSGVHYPCSVRCHFTKSYTLQCGLCLV